MHLDAIRVEAHYSALLAERSNMDVQSDPGTPATGSRPGTAADKWRVFHVRNSFPTGQKHAATGMIDLCIIEQFERLTKKVKT